jgi:glycosyltransferase involved in cell wall biosynthesis
MYTSVRNGIYFDFHIVEMLRHHVDLFDEIVVNEGYSTDNTYERIKDLSPKIRIARNRWDTTQPAAWHRTFGDDARKMCTGDWCVKLDCDEFLPPWEMERLHKLIATTTRLVLPMRFLNFYANYKVYNPVTTPHWKYVIHRNVPDAHVVGDGSNVELDSDPWFGDEVPEDAILCHHFGAVRHAARLRQKWRNDSAMKRRKPTYDWVPGFIYDLLPHGWFDQDFLPSLRIYEGPYVGEVERNPAEFTRDNMKVYEYLKKQGAPATSGLPASQR